MRIGLRRRRDVSRPAAEFTAANPQGQILDAIHPRTKREDSWCPNCPEEEAVGLNEKQRTTLFILRKLFGMSGRVFIPQKHSLIQDEAPQVPQDPQAIQRSDHPPSAAVEFDVWARHERTEQLSFHATLRLPNGQESRHSFSYSFRESREISLRFSEDEMIDPLALDLAGMGLQPRRGGFSIDLSGDGKLEQLPDLGPGGAWLVYDRNGNGRVDDRSELFGPLSGDGFQELAVLDSNGNGWIESSDEHFSSLYLWMHDGQLRSLDEAGIYAISTTSLETPFTFVDTQGERLAQLQRSGVYVNQDQQLGSVQQLDVIA